MLSCMAMRMKSLVERKETHANASSGTYNATELHRTAPPSLDMSQQVPQSMYTKLRTDL